MIEILASKALHEESRIQGTHIAMLRQDSARVSFNVWI